MKKYKIILSTKIFSKLENILDHPTSALFSKFQTLNPFISALMF